MRGGRRSHGAAISSDHVLGAKQFSSYPRGRFGDLFPLPLPVDEFFPGASRELGSRRAQQRVVRRRCLLGRAAATVKGLNQLAGFENQAEWPLRPVNKAQGEVIRRVEGAHRERAPPPMQESLQAALMQLLKKKASGYMEVPDGPGQLASYVRSRLSLPRGQCNPVDLVSILPPRERDQLLNFETKMLLSDEEIAAEVEKGFEGSSYIDPQLDTDPQKYHEFISDLYNCKLIHFTNQPRCQVGAFVVTKKGDKQRLILDCRPANRLFRRPPTTILGSSEAWNRLEAEDTAQIFVAQEDVKDFFYRLQIDIELGRFFSLPVIDPEKLEHILGFQPPELLSFTAEPHRPIYPCMKVLPVGFSWAFHLAHECHMELARRALPQVPFLKDRTRAPRLGTEPGSVGTAMLIYADNNNHLGIAADTVDREQQQMITALHSKNLATHDITNASTLAESLGVRIDGLGGKVQPTAQRDWRLDRALQFLSRRPYITGEQLQVVVGHITCRALLNRSLMSVLRYSYSFIEQCYKTRQRLWASVAKELELFRVLMPLGNSFFRAEWDSNLLCTDACLSGYAVMTASFPWEEVATLGRHDERWRFRRTDGSRVAPRQQVFNTSGVFEDILTVMPVVRGEVEGPLEEDPTFPDVSQNLMKPEFWHKLWNAPVHFREPVHLIEARSVLGAFKHICRDSKKHGRRVVILNDNMGVVLSIQKGRCSNYKLLRIVRRIAAHSLATGTKLHVRWVPSELNVADEASRQWEPKSHPKSSWYTERGADMQEERGESLQQVSSSGGQSEDAKPGPRTANQQEEKAFSESESLTKWPGAKKHRASAAAELGEAEETEGNDQTDEVRKKTSCDSGRKRNPGRPLREGAAEERLCEEAERVLRVHRPVRSPDWHGGRIRCSIGGLCRPSLPKWGGKRCGDKAESRSRISPTRSCKKWNPAPAQIQEIVERVEEVGAKPDQVANGGARQECHLRSDAAPGVARDGVVQRVDILHVCQARGADEGKSLRCGGEVEEGGQRHHNPCSFRKRGGVKDWDFRRGVDPGRQEAEQSRPVDSGHGSKEGEETGAPSRSLGLQCQKVLGGLEVMRGSLRSRGASKVTLPEQTWGGFEGPLARCEECTGNPASGALGSRQLSAHLRQTRQTAANPEQDASELGNFWRAGQTELRRVLPRWHLPVAERGQEESPGMFQGMSFLSLFGGVGNPARFFAREGGCACVVDLSDSPSNDLGKHSVWNEIDRIASSADVVGIDLPCNTWSRARRAPAWSRTPKPLRQLGEHIYGLDNVTLVDSQKVESANVMLKRSVRVIRRSLKRNGKGYLENPWLSMVWHTPEIQRLLKDPRVHLVRLDACQYDCAWKKPTGLLMWGVSKPQFKVCHGFHFCSRTKKRHVQLTGISGGRFLTQQAQVYSHTMARALMLSFSHPTQPPLMSHAGTWRWGR